MRRGDDNSSSNGASVSQKQSHSVLSQFLATAPMACVEEENPAPGPSSQTASLGLNPSLQSGDSGTWERRKWERRLGEAGWWQEQRQKEEARARCSPAMPTGER